ncbi:helix-turn-helix domain-containing protein [Streptomyces albogriseolus]
MPGLRREEVATLAGVSTDYYTRLERHPSPQILDAVARALRLDDEAVAHLYRVAGPAARRTRPATGSRTRSSPGSPTPTTCCA